MFAHPLFFLEKYHFLTFLKSTVYDKLWRDSPLKEDFSVSAMGCGADSTSFWSSFMDANMVGKNFRDELAFFFVLFSFSMVPQG